MVVVFLLLRIPMVIVSIHDVFISFYGLEEECFQQSKLAYPVWILALSIIGDFCAAVSCSIKAIGFMWLNDYYSMPFKSIKNKIRCCNRVDDAKSDMEEV